MTFKPDNKPSWALLDGTIPEMKRVVLRKGKPVTYFSRRMLIAALGISFIIASTYSLTVDGDLSVSRITHASDNSTKQAPIQSTVVFLTTTGTNSYSVPVDWNNVVNTVECVGGGGNGGSRRATSGQATGGGGGAYSAGTISGLTPGGTTSYNVGAVAGDTWFVTSGTLLAKGGSTGANGAAASSVSGGAGGAAGSGIGTTKFSGGNGGNVTAANACATGGGGAAGPNAAGTSAANTGTSGAATAGGRGDGTSGGTGGSNTGGNGNAGTEWDATHGSGGGGGGRYQASGTASAGSGGLYGAGGGGCVLDNSVSGTANFGPGAQGIIVITYTPVAATARSFGIIFG